MLSATLASLASILATTVVSNDTDVRPPPPTPSRALASHLAQPPPLPQQPCAAPLRRLRADEGHPPRVSGLADAALLSELCTAAGHPSPAAGASGGASSFLQLEFQEEQAEWAAPEAHGPAPSPRGGHCAHLVLDTLYIYGGCTKPRQRCFNDISALDLGTNTWSRVAAAGNAPHPASHPACGSAGADLAVFGGYSGSYSNHVHFFNAERRAWGLAEPAGSKPKPRQGASLTRVAGAFYLFGGSDDVQV